MNPTIIFITLLSGLVLFVGNNHALIPNIHFPQKFHAEDVGFDINEATNNKPSSVKMETCLECHQQTYDDKKCSQCHVGKPSSHNSSWQETHKVPATKNREQCMLCHKENSCDSCHKNSGQGKKKPATHVGDWNENHSQVARMNADQCATCHTTEFCSSCHITIGRHATQSGSSSTVPASHSISGFLTPSSSSIHHSKQFRRNAGSCLVCHPNAYVDPDCSTACHSGVNPHPANYNAPHTAMCNNCHVAGGVASSDPF